MDFGTSIKTCFSKYADFNGRASRSEYWWFSLFTVLGYIVTAFIHEALYGVFVLGTLLPTIAVGARRLHDTGRSGWMQLIMLIPLIGALVLLYFVLQPGEGENRFGEPIAVA